MVIQVMNQLSSQLIALSIRFTFFNFKLIRHISLNLLMLGVLLLLKPTTDIELKNFVVEKT